MATRDRYKQRRSNRKTFSFHLAQPTVLALDTLIDRGLFENRSHAVDEALLLLLRLYAHPEPMRESEPANAA